MWWKGDNPDVFHCVYIQNKLLTRFIEECFQHSYSFIVLLTRFFHVLVESWLLICFCYFVCMILVTYVLCCVLLCFPCLVFVTGLHSFDYRYNLGSLDYSSSLVHVYLICSVVSINYWLLLYCCRHDNH